MISSYLLKLALVLPLTGGLAVALLLAWRKIQPRLGQPLVKGPVHLVDSIGLGTAGRLAVVEFGGRQLLLSVSRSGISCVAEHPVVPSDD